MRIGLMRHFPVDVELPRGWMSMAELMARTGLGLSVRLGRPSTTLPDAVDQVTPDGQFPPVSMSEPRSI